MGQDEMGWPDLVVVDTRMTTPVGPANPEGTAILGQMAGNEARKGNYTNNQGGPI
jgi:hypothetical protein